MDAVGRRIGYTRVGLRYLVERASNMAVEIDSIVLQIRDRLADHPHFRGRTHLFQIEAIGDSIVVSGKVPTDYRRPSADDMGDWAEEAPQTIHRIGPGGDRRAGGVGRRTAGEPDPRRRTGGAHQQIDRDARRVGELQRALLPASLPRIAGLEIAASYEPLGRAGGDLYDLFPLDERQDDRGDVCTTPSRWCIFIGDVEGHGLAAALVMAIVQAVLHAHPAGIATPASLLMYANRQLCSQRIGGLVTAFLGIYEPASRRLTYARAGHPPPLLRRAADGSIGALDAVGSYPLGIDESETFQEAAVQLERGDTLLLYTDGITEAQGTAEDLFGVDRLTRVSRRRRPTCGTHRPPARGRAGARAR